MMLRRSGMGTRPTYAPEIVHDVLTSSGAALDLETRGKFESSLGRDFSQVRIHTGPRAGEAALAVDARAFTVGSDIVFGAGEYRPSTPDGTRLMAHELTHVVQQTQPSLRRDSGTRLRISDPDDTYERQARGAEARTLASVSTAVQRAPKTPDAGTRKAADAGITPDAGTQTKPKDISHAGNILTDLEKDRIREVTGASPPSAPPKFGEPPRFVIHDTAVRVEDPNLKPKPALGPADAGTAAAAAVTGAATGPAAGAAAEAAAGAAAATAGRTLSPAQLEDWRRKSETAKAEEHRKAERGPLDEGAAVWVLRTGDAVVARPNFFDPRRPTATEYEKRKDLLSQETRERAFQAIWAAVKPDVRKQAMQQSLAGLELTLTPKEQAFITKKATLLEAARKDPKIKPKDVRHEARKGLTPADIELEKGINERAITERKLTPGEVSLEHETATSQLEAPLPASYEGIKAPIITTTASWAVAQICALLGPKTPATDLTDTPEKAKNLIGACGTLSGYFQARDVRTGALVNVEVFPSAKGSDCETDPDKVIPLPKPAYEEGQYDAIAKTYLQAALQAGRFPEVTTHFWVDRKIKGAHCDPRCFDLQHLYDKVAGQFGDKLGHAPGSRYGDKPKPGIVQDTNNVWWHPKVCGPPPS